MNTPISSKRRDFLSVKSLGHLVSTVTGGELQSLSPAPQSTGEGMYYRFGRVAMASRFEVLVEVHDSLHLTAIEAALDRIDDLDSQLSVYQETSEISYLNQVAFEQEVPLKPELFRFLLECNQLWEDTAGCFDVAIHSLLKVWGLYKPPRRVPTETEINQAKAACGMKAVHLDRLKQTIRYSHPDLGINLAAIGKGYALDCAAEELSTRGVKQFLIHGGHSSLLARGSSSWEQGWLTSLVSPLDWETPLAQIRLEDRALSTSALDAESIRGNRPPHVIDPRTGYPISTDLVSVSVCSSKASQAEGLSTAFLVMGLDKTLEYCEKHPELGVVILRRVSDEDHLEVIHTGFTKDTLEVLV
jgi:thiamine biosynthesis lipoprotein